MELNHKLKNNLLFNFPEHNFRWKTNLKGRHPQKPVRLHSVTHITCLSTCVFIFNLMYLWCYPIPIIIKFGNLENIVHAKKMKSFRICSFTRSFIWESQKKTLAELDSYSVHRTDFHCLSLEHLRKYDDDERRYTVTGIKIYGEIL